MEISTTYAEQRFYEHLSLNNNNRIIFSGKFGTGKSYFLNRYFKQKEEDFNLFWLSPVNYVVGANQDIFEWIKIDIAKILINESLFSKGKEQFTNNLLLQTYIYQNASSIFTSLISTIGNTALKTKTGFDFLKTFKKQIEGYKTFTEHIDTDSKLEFEAIQKYLDQAFQIKGSIYEDDLTTQTIRAAIDLLRCETKKENVLVIDDLDRLDPEHIFRILNILSSHNDHFDTNKFGFDRVIVVCDYNNINQLYKHKYGPNIDFEGYIEKFYTYEPFYFTINDAIISYCKDGYSMQSISENGKKTLTYLLSIFCKYKHLRIRNIKKIVSDVDVIANVDFYEFTHNFGSLPLSESISLNIISSTNIFTINYNEHDFFKILQVLIIAFGGINNLRNAINETMKDCNYPIESEYAEAINRIVTIPYHFSQNINNPTNLFFSWEYNNYDGLKRLIDPSVKFLGNNNTIYHRWTNNLKYNSGDFFKQSNIVISTQNNDTRKNNSRDLLEAILEILKFSVDKGIFRNLNNSYL